MFGRPASHLRSSYIRCTTGIRYGYSPWYSSSSSTEQSSLNAVKKSIKRATKFEKLLGIAMKNCSPIGPLRARLYEDKDVLPLEFLPCWSVLPQCVQRVAMLSYKISLKPGMKLLSLVEDYLRLSPEESRTTSRQLNVLLAELPNVLVMFRDKNFSPPLKEPGRGSKFLQMINSAVDAYWSKNENDFSLRTRPRTVNEIEMYARALRGLVDIQQSCGRFDFQPTIYNRRATILMLIENSSTCDQLSYIAWSLNRLRVGGTFGVALSQALARRFQELYIAESESGSLKLSKVAQLTFSIANIDGYDEALFQISIPHIAIQSCESGVPNQLDLSMLCRAYARVSDGNIAMFTAIARRSIAMIKSGQLSFRALADVIYAMAQCTVDSHVITPVLDECTRIITKNRGLWDVEVRAKLLWSFAVADYWTPATRAFAVEEWNQILESGHRLEPWCHLLYPAWCLWRYQTILQDSEHVIKRFDIESKEYIVRKYIRTPFNLKQHANLMYSSSLHSRIVDTYRILEPDALVNYMCPISGMVVDACTPSNAVLVLLGPDMFLRNGDLAVDASPSANVRQVHSKLSVSSSADEHLEWLALNARGAVHLIPSHSVLTGVARLRLHVLAAVGWDVQAISYTDAAHGMCKDEDDYHALLRMEGAVRFLKNEAQRDRERGFVAANDQSTLFTDIKQVPLCTHMKRSTFNRPTINDT